MTAIKVDDLEGIELDYWVAKAEGLFWNNNHTFELYKNGPDKPVIDWNFIGPIIERDKIITHYSDLTDEHWISSYIAGDSEIICKGESCIQAIKRLIVKRKYGETVE